MAAAGRARRARDRRRQRFHEEGEERVELHRIDPEAERASSSAPHASVRSGTRTTRRQRSPRVRETARGDANLLPPMRDALRARCTVGEICETLREEWGMYDALRPHA